MSFARKKILSFPEFVVVLLSLSFRMCYHVSAADSEPVKVQCLTEDDLDFETCNLEDLTIPSLSAICDRLGLTIESQIFPYLFDEEELPEGVDAAVEEENMKKERTHSDYVEAATECLEIEQEMEGLFDGDTEGLSDLETQMLEDDPGLLHEVMQDILKQDPELIAQLEQELKDDPAMYAELFGESGELGFEGLADRPDILAELISVMLKDDPLYANDGLGMEDLFDGEGMMEFAEDMDLEDIIALIREDEDGEYPYEHDEEVAMGKDEL